MHARTALPALSALVLLIGMAAGCRSASSSPPPPVVDVELPVTVDAVGAQAGFVVSVKVGGTPAEVVLDTGSAGLRILPGFVDTATAFESITDSADTETFASGQVFNGVKAYARVGLGGASTPAIPVMLVRSVTCTQAFPSCSHGLGGLAGIMGVGMRNSRTPSGIGNPIVQLAGSPSYLVEAPAFQANSVQTGTVLIGPTSAEKAAFKTVQLLSDGRPPLENGTPSWDDEAVPVCVDDSALGDWCAGALLDTGTGPLLVDWAAYTGTSMTLAAGSAVAVVIGTALQIGQYSFVVSATPEAGQNLVDLNPTTSASSINLGTSVFFRYAVLFDASNGLIGLKPS